ncbi:hypothetical protein NT6N_26850 [Oceaniferula spumae]|uniref:Glycosyltransferase n=1 Tax=Oceaniferula spumae TaxID=2979115 RepID=A0AAT9FNQ2_9BACT
MGMETFTGQKLPANGDIIHLHGLTGWIGLRGLESLIPEGSRVFWTTHDLWPLSGGCIIYSGCNEFRNHCRSCPILKTGTKQWAQHELRLKFGFVKSKHILPIANSRWMAHKNEESKVFSEVGKDEYTIVHPIIDAAYFDHHITDIRASFQIAPGKHVLALGARAVTDRFKGIPEFLTAFAKREKLASNCVILLFGDGEIELPSNLDVRPMGRLESASELAEVYFTSDVFVSPSSMETFGMAIAEAQACGTPIVAFDVGGVHDAVSDECAGYLVPDRDWEKLLDAVERALKKQAVNGGRWRVNRDWARDRFDGSVIAKRQLEVYKPGSK